MASEQLSLRISSETKKRLEELAEVTGRNKTYLAIDAIEKYLDIESWQISAIKQGIKDIDNGEFISIENIKKDWNL